MLANHIFGLERFAYTGHDGTFVQTGINQELHKFGCLGNRLSFENGADTDIELGKVFKLNIFLGGLRLPCGLFVGLLGVEQTLNLCIDGGIFNLFEQKFGSLQSMTFGQQIGATQRFPSKAVYIEHVTQFGSAERQERIEGNRQVSSDLQRNIHDGCHAVHIGFGQFPRFGVGQVFVTDTSQVHGFFLRIAETEHIEVFFQSFLYVHKFLNGCLVVIAQLAKRRHFSIEIFVCKDDSTVDKVTENSHQFVVVASLKIFPSEVVVLGFGRIGSEHIAQNILLAGEIHQIFVQPNSPVARGRNLVVFEVQKFVAGHIVGQDVAAFGLQHSGENDAMENDIVFSDKMNQTGFGIFPPFFPRIGQQFLGVGNITDGRIEPNIEHFTFGTFHGNGNTPIQVAAHGTRLQAYIQPTFTLTIHIGTPFLMIFQNPLTQPAFVLIQRQIPVLGFLHHRLAAADGTFRIDQIGGRQSGTTFFALVTISTFSVTMRTFSGDIAVGQESFGFFVVILLRSFFDKFAFFVQSLEEIGS